MMIEAVLWFIVGSALFLIVGTLSGLKIGAKIMKNNVEILQMRIDFLKSELSKKTSELEEMEKTVVSLRSALAKEKVRSAKYLAEIQDLKETISDMTKSFATSSKKKLPKIAGLNKNKDDPFYGLDTEEIDETVREMFEEKLAPSKTRKSSSYSGDKPASGISPKGWGR